MTLALAILATVIAACLVIGLWRRVSDDADFVRFVEEMGDDHRPHVPSTAASRLEGRRAAGRPNAAAAGRAEGGRVPGRLWRVK